MPWISRDNLERMNFAELGQNVYISDKASIHNCEKIAIGNNVRIDDFCVISAGAGGIRLGNYIHIGVFSSLIGRGKITFSDFSSLSSRVSIYSSSDDPAGLSLSGPMVPENFTNVRHSDIFLGRHSWVATVSIILPGATLEDGVFIQAMSVVYKKCEAFGIYGGNPLMRLRDRKRDLLELEKQFMLEDVI